MNKIKSLDEALERVHDGMTVMFGGFMAVGTPEKTVDALLAKGVKDLTVICNDSGMPDKGVGKLVAARRIKHLIASHVGTNPETGRQMNAGEMKVDLIPQGTLAERIRSGGAGLGGFLTPTGVGTIVEEGKQRVEIGGETYLLELPLKADIAFLKAHKADPKGNLVYRRASRNFNPLMATAAEFVIAQVEHIVGVGEIDPDEVMTPGIFVDAIIEG